MKSTQQSELSVLTPNIILEHLFPEGLDKCEIWNKIIVPLTGKHACMQKWEHAVNQRLRLKKRIEEQFPDLEDQVKIAMQANIPILRKISRDSPPERFQPLIFGEKSGAFFEIEIVGSAIQDFILDLAAVSVVSMLIVYAKPDFAG